MFEEACVVEIHVIQILISMGLTAYLITSDGPGKINGRKEAVLQDAVVIAHSQAHE